MIGATRSLEKCRGKIVLDVGMARILLFHHVYGVTPGLEGLADDLRRAGHEVLVPEGDLLAARVLVASAPKGTLYLYPGDAHCFYDPSTPGYDARADEVLRQRILALCASAP